MKRADKFLALTVLGVCMLLFLLQITGQIQGDFVLVRVDGEVYGSYPLNEDAEILIGQTNRIVIQAGTVQMEAADCPDQLCVKQGIVSREGQMIVCLPNRVTIQICENGRDQQQEQSGTVPDAVAG